ncbi:MAG: helix-turn-helix domain-containing protein [Candidatus Marinimicrobia bacterium]|jgi:transposase, IS30 family|nr:helix-turn-helix domain-containing protein [Candidatus Neomarinimicrobiota bacterium]MBT5224617.1 helix-turn-helix domain-containing protein [Candidatus Neomarinimicrobiota bacterium]MBT6936725.1 helix-turn-helix domain-containing protein [Candidatus Neomarinimicrobiota bacterium]MBT6938782.1 helix-turn-helix domain-containing protein [Candidatus Neomarinimicrobiota bacterium]
MKHYSQLTLEQRYIIYSMLKIGYSQTAIAKVIGVHKSTIPMSSSGCLRKKIPHTH